MRVSIPRLNYLTLQRAALVACLALAPAGCRLLFGDPAECEDIEIPEDMRCIPAGPFTRGSDRTAKEEDTGRPIRDEAPAAIVTLSAFLIDATEVTYARYQECFAAGACTRAGPNYRGYNGPRMPMVGLTWFQARDYCRFRGKRLPTEAEWEKAARGPDGDLLPWGDESATCERAIIQENNQKGCGTGKTWDVASRPAYRYGLYDMAGNSWEWVNDWYSDDYARCGAACAGQDPQGPCAGADQCPGSRRRVIKGGSWWWDAEYAEGSNRRAHFPSNQPFHHLGFRCAKTIEGQ